MIENPMILRALENLGTAGLIILVLWRLTDKWAAKFLGAQVAQAQAMQSMADAVRSSQDDQRDLLIAMRVVASKIDDVKDTVDKIASQCPAAICRFPGERKAT